jgi:hypothetical protein
MSPIRMLPIAALTLLVGASRAPAQSPATPAYDGTLAKKVGADERGMRNYVLVILETGPFANNAEGWRGLYLFAVTDIDEARALVATDPLIIKARWSPSTTSGTDRRR